MLAAMAPSWELQLVGWPLVGSFHWWGGTGVRWGVLGLDMALHVLTQLEGTVTEGTVEVAFVRVGDLMSPQLPGLGEAHPAHGTGVCLLLVGRGEPL